MESSRMASSPPQSASLDIPPSSPDQSRYVLNLDALGSESGFSSPSSDHTEPLITSDDIGGPSDFTLHLMDYMTGKLPIKPKQQKHETDRITTGTPNMARNLAMHLQPTVEDYNSEAAPSRAANTPTPSPQPQRTTSGMSRQNSTISPMQTQGGASPHLRSQVMRLGTELAAEKRMRAADKVTYKEEVESKSEQHKHELQAAAVELRTLRATHQAEMQGVLAQHRQELQASGAEQQTASQNHESSIRDMKAQLAAQIKAAFEQERHDHVAELQRVKTQHVKHLQAAAEEIEQQKTVRKQEAEGYEEETKRIKAQHMEDMRVATRHAQSLNDYHALEMQRATAQNSQFLDDMQSGIKHTEALKAAHTQEMERVKTQTAEYLEDMQTGNKRIETLRTEHAKDMGHLKAQNAQLLANMETAVSHAEKLEAAHAEKMGRMLANIKDLTEEIENLKSTHATELERSSKRVTSNYTRTLETAHADAMSRVLADLQAGVEEKKMLKASHKEALEHASRRVSPKQMKSLETVHAAEMSSLHADLQAAIAENTALKAAESGSAKELKRVSSKHIKQLQSASDEIDELTAANKAHIDVLMKTMEERLMELETLKVAHAETERMNKALGKEVMRAWGREEFGDTGEKQKYRYKHVRV